MLKENWVATGGQLYQEKPNENSRDTISIRPATKWVLFPQNTLYGRLKAARKLSSIVAISAWDIIPNLRPSIPYFMVLMNRRAFCPA